MKNILLIMGLLVIFQVAYSQENYKVHTYNNEIQGLPTEVIKATTTDKWGFLWLATDEGLVRFDGKHLTQIPNLPSPYIKGFLKRRNGDLWVFHDRGIHQIFSKPDTAYVVSVIKGTEKKQKDKAFYPKALFETSDSTVWVGENQDLLAYRNGKIQRYDFGSEDNADSYVRSYSFFEDTRGNFGTISYNGNLYLFDKVKDRFERIASFNNIGSIQDMVSINDSTYWLGTYQGVFEMTIKEKKATLKKLIDLKSVSCFFRLSKNEVYIGTWVTGMYKMLIDSKKLIAQKIKPQSINRITAQNQNINIWISTNEGFLLLQNHFFQGLRFENSTNFINHVKEYNGKVYATDGGSIHIICRNNDWVECERLHNLNVGMLTSFIAQENTMLIANKIGQIFQYDKKTEKKEELLEKSIGFIIPEIYLDKRGTLWVNSSDGQVLIRIKNKKSTYYRKENYIFNPISIIETDKNDIFITQKGNNTYLLKYNAEKDKFDNISIPVKIKESFVIHDAQAHGETIFMATSEGIWLYDLDKKTIKQLPLAEYTKEVFRAIAVAKNGNLWLGHAKGVLCYNNGKITSYNHLSGLPSKSVIFRCIKLDEKEENVWIGTSTGLAVGKNQQETTIRKTQTPILTKIEVNDQPLDIEKQINYAFERASYIKFQFLALDFPREQITYQYRLLGYDSTWKELDEKTEFIVPPLENGNYEWQLRAIKAGGYQLSDELKIPFKIFPPWYKTWQAYLLYILVFLSLLYLLYRLNNLRLQIKTRRLEQLILQRTEEVNIKNRELEGKQQEIMVQNEELRQQQEEILAQRDNIAIKNKELFEQTEKIEAANRNMGVISEIGQQITATLELEKAINILYKYINQIMDADEFGIGTYNSYNQIINYDFYIYEGKRLPFFQSSVEDDRFSSWVIKNQKSVFFGDIRYEYHDYIKDFSHYEGDQLLNSMICTPLIIGEKVIGLMSVQSPRKHAYTEYHFDILQALASYVSIALENTASYHIIEEKNRNITDSIRYAQNIQQAILPPDEKISSFFEDYFVIFIPKDIVSGDFYWLTHFQNKTFVAVVDCTGHGVPGAFMSMIGNTLLNEIINIEKIVETHEILSQLDQKIRLVLQQDSHKNQDGMDVGLCSIEPFQDLFRVSFSGAKSNLFYKKEGKIEKIKGDRHSIGGFQKKEINRYFSKHELFLPSNSLLYLYSDGFIDQSNADDQRIGSLRLETWINEIYQEDLTFQKQFFLKKLQEHKQDAIQRDDITFLGLKI